MIACEADYDHIALAIQRLLDAEVIETESGESLLAEASAGRRLLEQGDEPAARLHAERLAAKAVALIGSGKLDLLEGRAVIETVGGLLSGPLEAEALVAERRPDTPP